MPATCCSTELESTAEKSAAIGWTKSSPRGRPPSRFSQPSQSSSGPRVDCLLLRYGGGRDPQGLDLVDPQSGLVRPVPPTSSAVRPAVRSSGARRAQPRCANTKGLEAGIAQVAGDTSSGWTRRFAPSGPLVRSPGSRGLAPLRFHFGGQLLRLTEKTTTPSVLWSFPLVMCHHPKATRRLGKVDPP